MKTPLTNQNALATPSRSTAAVFSEESETLNRVAATQRERERFQAWWQKFNEDGDLGAGDMRLVWAGWLASARAERTNA